ncbi:MAG: ATP-binding protein [Gammaproteobacteria bacterium]
MMALPSLKRTVPLLLLAFAGILSAVDVLYHIPRAERTATNRARERLFQDLSRLQGSVEYLVLKGDLEGARREATVLGSNPECEIAMLLDDTGLVMAATRRAFLGQPAQKAVALFNAGLAQKASRERRAYVVMSADGNSLFGYTGVLARRAWEELRPSRLGLIFIAYDLGLSRAEARAQILAPSLYRATLVGALALVFWCIFHFVLTRRAERLVAAAERLAAGDLGARGGLVGGDELARLGGAFDTMAAKVAETQTLLRADIEERERTEAALRASEASYRAIFDAAEDAIFVHEIPSGRVIDTNPRASSAYGYTREELLAIDIGTMSSGEPPYTQEEATKLIARAIAGEQLRFEWHRRNRDGSLRWDEVLLKRVVIGGQDRVLAMTRDITDRKEAAEALSRQREALYQREKLAALGSLLAGVAHELNNPLAVVVARAVLLEEADHPPTRAAAKRIRAAAERCARIVRTFLAMARQRPPERSPIVLNDLITAALDVLGYGLRTSGIGVALALEPDLPSISADADQIHQVFMNLFVNAQQALQDRPPPRRIRIASRLDPGGKAIRVVVADNGPGIPEAARARIFEPYFTTKPMGAGIGVGLSVSLAIIEGHGGTLTLEPPREGGAAFTIVLPVETAAGPVAVVRPLPVVATAGRVLIVDDETEVRDTLREILEGDGHRITTAGCGREALERMGSEPYDVILTDLRMPDLDGQSLYREIAERWPEHAAGVVFITGDTLAPALRELAGENGRPVIEKPFLPVEVRRVIAEVMACRRAALDTFPPTQGGAR